MADTNTIAPGSTAPHELNLVCGAGGSRAILGTTGAILAADALGISRWHTIGGISGGSIPSLMLASGMPARDIARHVIEIDFNSMLTPRTHLLGVFWAFFLKECAWKRRKERGVLSSEKVGDFVESYSPRWPKNYWTVAVAGDRQLLFTADGVFEYFNDGRSRRQISDKPAPVGLAIRASCAVPGVIDAVEFQGEFLLDGGLCADGRCPVGVVKRELGAPPASIVALDVGEASMDSERREHWFWRTVRRIVCGPCCDPEPSAPVDAAGGVVLVTPAVSNMESLEFKLSPDQKWQALMSGFTAAASALEKTGRADPASAANVRSVVAAYRELSQKASRPGEIAAGVQAILKSHGLY